MSATVAALFVHPQGPYVNRDDVDAWTEGRDARLYDGTLPVVAHPPCNLWVNLAALNFKRYGGEHNRPGNDGGCFSAALSAVRRCGGVLEHPAFSRAWYAYGLPLPTAYGWSSNSTGERVCEVWQSAYGHKARKRTWLFYHGASGPPEMKWSRRPGVSQCGWFDRIKPTLSKREASRTPPRFCETLLRLARHAVEPAT